MKTLISLLLTTLAFASGCATTDGLSSQMAGWQGNNIGAAIEAWGIPDAEQDFGDQTVFIWRDRAYGVLPINAETDTSSAIVICERMLAVTDAGTVTGWRWRGDACPGMHTDMAAGHILASSAAH